MKRPHNNQHIFSLSIFILFVLSGASRCEAFKSHSPIKLQNRDISLENLQILVEEQASVIQNLQSELSATQTRLEQVQSQLDTRVDALESNDQDRKNELTALNNKISKSVAFTVRFSNDPIPDVGHHAILKFDLVQFNMGSGYDPNTGIFTAPVSGVYGFFLSLMGSWQWSEMSLVKDGSTVDSVHVNDDTFDQGSLFETLHMKAGEMVWVQHSYGSTAIKGGAWTDFTGFLLKAD